jgi:integrase
MRQHGHRIDKATVRAKLQARGEPYWLSLGSSRSVGFRRSAVRGGTWHARWTEPWDKITSSRPKYWQQSLGTDDEIDYGRAVELARKYFEGCERHWHLKQTGGIAIELETVNDACRAYIKSLRETKGDEPADSANGIFKRAVYDDPVAKIRLKSLTRNHVEAWRNGLVRAAVAGRRGRSKRGANRMFRQLAAALSFAKQAGAIQSDPWKQVGLFPVADGRRPAYLTLEQRHALIAACEREKTAEELAKHRRDLPHCDKDLAVLLRGWFFTGARPGELAKARVRDLSLREQKITLVSAKNKKGEARPRDFFLFEPGALSFFTLLMQGKGPDQFLVTRHDGRPWIKKGRPEYWRWGRGMQAAIREANKVLPPEHQIAAGTVAYTARHTVITDLLSQDGIDQPSVEEIVGTSAQMIRKHYFKLVRERLQEKLAKRRSI